MSGLSVKEIIENDGKFAASGDPILGEIDPKQATSSLLRLSGYGYYPYWQFQDAFEDMSTERMFALFVLASALDDIDPLDTKPPPDWHPSKIAALFRAQDRERIRRIVRQQKLEADHRAEGRSILSEYHSRMRALGISATAARAKVRYVCRRKWQTFLRRVEDKDLTNTSLKWFVTDRKMVEFWCHMADVNLERCYLAAERRLLSLGRCSPELRKIVTALRGGREWKYEIEMNPLHRYENRAWQALFNEPLPSIKA